MLLAVMCSDLTRLVEAEASVEDAALVLYKLWDATSNDIGLSLTRNLGQHLTCFATRIIFKALELDWLSVCEHIFLLERCNEHLRQHDYLGST